MKILSLLVFLILAHAQDAVVVGPSCPDLLVSGVESKEKLFAFLAQLKLAKDPDALVKQVIFPLRVNGRLKNKQEVKKRFQEVFTPKVMKAIAEQEKETIFCRDQGVMLGDGEIWLGQRKGRIGIISLNP